MKKIIILCTACLLALSSCAGNGETVSPSPVATQTVSPTVTPLAVETPLVTATPVPTDTVPPVETAPDETLPLETQSPEPEEGWNGRADTLTLDDFRTQLSSSDEVLEAAAAQPDESALLLLIAQLPESDTWLYGVYGPQKEQSLILRVGTQWEQFSIPFLTSQGLLPQMYYGDFDGDMALELALLSYADSNPEGSEWSLSVIEFGDGGSWSAFYFDPADYAAILDQSITCSYAPATNVATLQAGDSTLALNLTDRGYPDPGEPVTASCGQVISFHVEDDALSGSFSIHVNAPNLPPAALVDVAQVRADIVYTGSAFGLNALTLSLPEA